jgi:glycosyltransferase 2 family protein
MMSTSNRRSRRAVVVTLVVGVPLSAVFLWLSIRDADLAAVWGVIDGARPVPLVGTIGLLALMYWLQAVRWRRIAEATALPRRSVYGMLIAALAVNNVVPGRIGDFLRANWMSRATHVPGGRALAGVVVDRGGDLIVLAVSLVVCLPLITHAPWVDRLVVGAVVVVGAFLATLVAARLYARRRPRGGVARTGLVRRLAHDTLDGLSEPMPPSRIVGVLALSVGAWLAWSCSAILCGRAIGIELSLVEALFLAGAVNLGVAIPSSPGFVGTYQWLVISTLALYGVGREDALAFAVVFQACWYIPTTLVGGVLLARRMPTRVRVPMPPGAPPEQRAAARA